MHVLSIKSAIYSLNSGYVTLYGSMVGGDGYLLDNEEKFLDCCGHFC